MPSVRAASASTRPQNLSRVLRLVHESGAISRAMLTEATGLNRSTIADLVGELTENGLVFERMPEAAGRVGRPSPVVEPASDVVVIAANPEVDALEIAAVGLDRSIRLRERIENEAVPSPEDTARAIGACVRRWKEDLLAHARIVAVGLAVPGLVRSGDGLVRNAPHLGWRDVPIAQLVANATGLDAFVGNDASLGVLAEHTFGAAQGLGSVVYLNGGASGIGGGMILHGLPVLGTAGYAGEFGQSRIDAGDDGEPRTLESEVNRRRLLNAVGLRDAEEHELAAALAESDDPAVAAEIERQRGILAGALANAINLLNPSVVVLGGFLATIQSLDEDALDEAVADLVMPECAEDVFITPAALGADRLLIGAAEAAFMPLLQDPS